MLGGNAEPGCDERLPPAPCEEAADLLFDGFHWPRSSSAGCSPTFSPPLALLPPTAAATRALRAAIRSATDSDFCTRFVPSCRGLRLPGEWLFRSIARRERLPSPLHEPRCRAPPLHAARPKSPRIRSLAGGCNAIRRDCKFDGKNDACGCDSAGGKIEWERRVWECVVTNNP